jgi:hypothetical protein
VYELSNTNKANIKLHETMLLLLLATCLLKRGKVLIKIYATIVMWMQLQSFHYGGWNPTLALQKVRDWRFLAKTREFFAHIFHIYKVNIYQLCQ